MDGFKQGVYALQLFKDGQKKILIIDDFLVTEDETPISMEAQLWAHLIEKAMAKMYGTYMDLYKEEQNQWQIYNDLTGAKSYILEMKEESLDIVR